MELRSHNITKGVERVPNRSLLRACGLTEEEMARPIIGVVSAYSEIRVTSIWIKLPLLSRPASAWLAAHRFWYRQSASVTALRWVISA